MIIRLNKNSISLDNKVFLFGFLWILFFYLPYLIFWDNSYVPITDNIEMFAILKSINKSNIFADNSHIIDTELLGIPRISYYSEFYYLTFISTLLDGKYNCFIFWLINTFFISIIAYIGMYKLLKLLISDFFKHPLVNSSRELNLQIVITIISLIYACSPHYIFSGLSDSGQPLILYAFLKILMKKELTIHWLLLICFPFFSNFYFSNMYFFSFLFLILVINSIYYKKINKNGFLAILILILFTIIVDYRLFIYALNPFFESNRTTKYISRTHIGLFELLKETLLMIKQEFTKNPFYFMWGYYDPIIRYDNFLIIISYFFITPFFIRKKSDVLLFLFFLLFNLILMSSIANPLFLKIILSKIFIFIDEKIFYSFSTRYISNISQLFFCLMLFHTLLLIMDKLKNYTLLIAVFFLFFNIYQPSCHELNNPIMNNVVRKSKPKWKEYFDEKKFNELNNFLSKLTTSTYVKILVFSDFENIKDFNHQLFVMHGFKTVGGYNNIYPIKTFIKLDTLRKKIDKLSKEIQYKNLQLVDTRYMNFFLPKRNDTLLIDANILSYIPQLYSNILIASNKPIKNISSKSQHQLQFLNYFKGIKYDIYLYKIQ